MTELAEWAKSNCERYEIDPFELIAGLTVFSALMGVLFVLYVLIAA
jgi:hypothetical protein